MLKQKSLLPEVGFDSSLPLDNAIYRLSYTNDTELNPCSVTKDNFAVYDNTDFLEVEVKEAVYDPLGKKITLVLKPEMVYNSYVVYASDDVKDISGNSAAMEYDAEINAAYEVGIDGLSVLDMSFYNEDKKISQPVGTMSLGVNIRVLNSSDSVRDCELRVYLNDSADEPLILSDAKLKAADTTEFIFLLPQREYPDGAVVNITLQ
ncbi:MAG: hypothetical protein IJN96_03525 [Clostridia bacterium]|nr:hypothetical protein [Clostridia bacterium]